MTAFVSGIEKRDTRFAFAASVVVHGCLLLLFLATSFSAGKRPIEIVAVDFSLLNDALGRPSPGMGRSAVKTPAPPRGGKTASPKTREQAGSVGKHYRGTAIEEVTEASSAPTATPGPDTLEKLVVYDSPSTHTNRSDSAGPSQPGSGAGGNAPAAGEGQEGSGGHGSGQGSVEGLVAGGRDFSYIRDAVMRNVRYPEEARRLGIEGKVVLSFIVLEDGTTGSIELVKGSGYRFLDESARKAVTAARINRKVPYRVIVQLPITFRLQGKKGS